MKPFISVLVVIAACTLSGCNSQKANPPAPNPPIELPPVQGRHFNVQKKPVFKPPKDKRLLAVQNTFRSLVKAIEEKDQAKINHLTTAQGRESLLGEVYGPHEESRLRDLNELANGQIKAEWEVGDKNSVRMANEEIGSFIFVKQPHWKLKQFAIRID